MIAESVTRVIKENIDAHMTIDKIRNLLGGDEIGYNTLNMIL